MSAERWLAQGDEHRRAGRLRKAQAAYERAAALAPDAALCWLRVGTIRFRRGLILDAELPLRRALALEPGASAAAVCLATVLERSRRLEEAEALLAPFIDVDIPEATVAMSWAGLQRRLERPQDALPVVEAALTAELPADQRALLLFARGDLLDELERWEPAFRSFEAANRCRGFAWDAAAHSARVDRLIRAFDSGALATAARASVGAEDIALIVGVPRSGTTLLEQVLSSHSRVGGAGELDTLRRIGQRLSRAAGAPGAWFHQPRQVDAPLLDQCAEAYRATLVQRAGACERLTDKMPDNLLQLGLAQLMIPGCRVIHMQRDPVDVGWSCFRQAFGPGLAWAGSLEDIASYQSDAARLAAHWRTVLDLPLLELRYEDLVAEPEASVRRVLGFLGLDWEPGCLQFHRSARLVSTASHAQVQRPLHRGAVGRSAPYRAWLGPLYSAGTSGCAGADSGTVT